MLKKDLSLLVLILVIGCATAFLNPRFISPINLSNTANLIGLFGLYAIGAGFVIITGGIDLSVGSLFALLGVIFVDLLTTYQMNWIVAVLLMVVAGMVIGAVTRPPRMSGMTGARFARPSESANVAEVATVTKNSVRLTEPMT